MTPPPQIPLWRQLQASAHVLQAMRSGASGTAAISAVDAALRPGVQALSFAVWRNLGQAQALRLLLAPRKPSPQIDALLCNALALLSQPGDAVYDAFTLVNQTVEAAKKSPKLKNQAGFVNACLRRFLREQSALMAQVAHDPVARWNHPAWWLAQVQTEWPTQWQTILAANNAQAPMVLRVNTRRISVADYLRLLEAAGLAAKPLGLVGVVLQAATAVQQIPGFTDGLVSVQDSAAQWAAPLLLSGLTGQAPLQVLDACAAPGGKTAHLLEYADVTVTALDIDAQRCQRIHDNLQRLGLAARVLAADAADVPSWWQGQPFDAILLDAPCSGSGVVRRHPDIRWLRRPTDAAQLARQQARLLAVLWPLLKPGGRLLYCTCSVFQAEGQGQIQAFLDSNNNATLLPSPGHLLPGLPVQWPGLVDNPSHEHDGFYYALLQKSAA
ncbi:MAG: 16S rRNA (cytosine(967)-C(5))-methyltransferase RsmB [Rhodoferax sp.]|uniref:16S rRNA (cytosine(967)-C(5))-methyltransferase RsmB n=1 Tax=Rhodoferax sp. TaxID=50421 RepID=UPI0008B4063F|nr:16S rRNA (cytosine(967)-C(5))-methyltransferase RsmB [Rhodoferax sp.]MDP2677094.1 16S rRNA (cytosine(967)-C(5))-methyltransferase RsmB [Rhodoferax sp.]OGB54061.1 MAG: 16S rRNA (cytosine(967)-C(5))-methyltransferase [Burkholderiales bacterium RIFOXYD12_FULL_59_19]